MIPSTKSSSDRRWPRSNTSASVKMQCDLNISSNFCWGRPMMMVLMLAPSTSMDIISTPSDCAMSFTSLAWWEVSVGVVHAMRVY